MSRIQLAIQPKAGVALINEFDLAVEATTELEDPVNAPALDSRVLSAHAPFDFSVAAEKAWKGLRIHLASQHLALREASLLDLYRYIETAHKRFPNLRLINMHAAPKRFYDPPTPPHKSPPGAKVVEPDAGAWGRLVESVRQVGRRCATLGLQLSVENNLAYWKGVTEETPLAQAHADQQPIYWCTSPEEWAWLPRDVNEPNVFAGLDPSHVTAYVERFESIAERRAEMAKFLAGMPVMGHLHWNDSDVETNRGRMDMHLCIGEGTLGKEFHGALKKWAVEKGKIPLLEHFYSRERLVKELEYIDKL